MNWQIFRKESHHRTDNYIGGSKVVYLFSAVPSLLNIVHLPLFIDKINILARCPKGHRRWFLSRTCQFSIMWQICSMNSVTHDFVNVTQVMSVPKNQ